MELLISLQCGKYFGLNVQIVSSVSVANLMLNELVLLLSQKWGNQHPNKFGGLPEITVSFYLLAGHTLVFLLLL